MGCNCKKKVEHIALKYGDGDVINPKYHDSDRNSFTIIVDSFFNILSNIIIGLLAGFFIIVLIVPIILWIVFSICIGNKDKLTPMPDFIWKRLVKIIKHKKEDK